MGISIFPKLKNFSAIAYLCFSSSSFAADISPSFSWPSSGSVDVKEKTLKGGNQAITSYKLVWKTVDGKMLLSYKDFKFVSINSEPATDPKFREIEKITSHSLPQLVIDKDGHFVEALNIEATLAATGSFAKDKEGFKKVAANPAVKRALNVKIGELWFAWSELWSMVTIKGDKAKFNQTTGFFMLDAYKPSANEIEYYGPCTYSPKCAEMYLESKISGDSATTLLGEGLASVSATNKVNPQDVSINQSFSGKIDMATLRPYEVAVTKDSNMKLNGRAVSVREVHTYVFNWN